MRNTFLISIIVAVVLVLSMPSYAICKNDSRGEWLCFPADKSKISTGNCKNMDCPEGCVEANDGGLAHCCQKPTTDCRRNIYIDGCLAKTKIKCLPTQYCDGNGVCQDKEVATSS